MTLCLAPFDVPAFIVKGNELFCQWIHDAITTILVIALTDPYTSEVGAAAITGSDGNPLLIILLDPRLERQMIDAGRASPNFLLQGSKCLKPGVKGILAHFLKTFLAAVEAVLRINIE